MPSGDDDSTVLRVRLTREQASVAGPDAADILTRAGTLIEGLAALRYGRWSAGTPHVHTPDVEDWEHLLHRLGELEAYIAAVKAAAIREHAAAGGSVAELGDAMGCAKGTAQNRRQAVIGTAVYSIPPGPAEEWARTGGVPPWRGPGRSEG